MLTTPSVGEDREQWKMKIHQFPRKLSVLNMTNSHAS